MIEKWENINDNYLISNMGRIKNKKTNKILKVRPHYKKGYLHTNISIGGKLKTVFVHRLVAEAFIPNPENKPQVNHIDGNKQNNRIDNLEWCTAKENIHHAFENKLIINKCGEDCYSSKLSSIQVKEIRKMHALNRDITITDMAKKYNVSKKTIYNLIKYNTYKNIRE